MSGKEKEDRTPWSEELKKKIIASRYRDNGTNAQLGIALTDLGPGWAEGEMEIKEIHCNPLGSVHGGMLFTFADSVGGSAAATRGSWIVTSTSSISFFNAALHEKKLIAKAKELKAGKNLLTYEIEIFNEKGILIAKSTIEYVSLHIPIGRYDLLQAKQDVIVAASE